MVSGEGGGCVLQGTQGIESGDKQEVVFPHLGTANRGMIVSSFSGDKGGKSGHVVGWSGVRGEVNCELPK